MRVWGKYALALFLGQRAQTLAEYSLLISFIAVLVIILAVIAFREGVYELWQSAVEQLRQV